MSVREELVGARWSSATRCIARAEHEALGSPRDQYAQTFLEGAFVRGVNLATAWVIAQKALVEANGKTLIAEQPIPWGPNGMWTGHADAVIPEDKLVIECYHGVGGAFRLEKALQAVGYARKLSHQHRAMLVVFDATDIDEDEGVATTRYPLDAQELGKDTDEIMHKVSLAYLAGQVNADDKVGDSPSHSECRNCPFRDTCWAGWRPPEAEHVPELDDLAARLAILQGSRAATKAGQADLDERIAEIREEIRPYTRPGVPIIAGGQQIKRIEVQPRRSFKFAAYEAAGHLVTPTMREFLSESDEPGERWYVQAAR